jgi:6-phosphofructokinase 1
VKEVGGAPTGNVQLSGSGALADALTGEIKEKLKIKRVRGDTFGYLQRSFLGCVSDVDQREAREAGRRAARFAFDMERDGSVTITRTEVKPYTVSYGLERLEAIAGKTRVMPDSFISPSGSGVMPAFLEYLLPLLGSSIPVKATLRAPAVEKLLGRVS